MQNLCSLLHGCANVFKLEALHSCTGHYGIYILVHGDNSLNITPVVSQTGDIGQFFEEVMNKPFLQVLRDLDGWCTNGFKGIHSFGLIIQFI